MLMVIGELEEQMRAASTKLEFERAAHLRDQIAELKKRSHMAHPPSIRYPTGS